MNKKHGILSFGIISAFFAAVIFFVGRSPEAMDALYRAQFSYLATAVVFNAAFLYMNGLFLKVVMQKFEVQLRGWEAFHLSVVTTAGNSFLPMTSGMAIRAYYLKKVHRFGLTRFMGKLAGTYLLNYFVIAILGIVSAAYLFVVKGMTSSIINVLFTSMFLGLGYLIFFQRRLPKWKNRFWSKIEAVFYSWREIGQDFSLVWKLGLMCVGNVILNALIILACLQCIGVQANIFEVFYLTVLESLTLFVKVTPGNIGLSEALMVWGGTVIQIPASKVIIAALLVRISMYVALLIMFPFALFCLFGADWRKTLSSVQASALTDQGT